jgi:predicted transcriptional regulator
MPTTRKNKQASSAEQIARRADQGDDVSRFFTNRGRMVGPIQRVNVDFTAPMLAELDQAAEDLNVSRQAVIKTLLRQSLDQHYLATTALRQLHADLELGLADLDAGRTKPLTDGLLRDIADRGRKRKTVTKPKHT